MCVQRWQRPGSEVKGTHRCRLLGSSPDHLNRRPASSAHSSPAVLYKLSPDGRLEECDRCSRPDSVPAPSCSSKVILAAVQTRFRFGLTHCFPSSFLFLHFDHFYQNEVENKSLVTERHSSGKQRTDLCSRKKKKPKACLQAETQLDRSRYRRRKHTQRFTQSESSAF